MWPRIAAGVAILSFLFLAGEFALPRIAEDRVRGELDRQGKVESVEVDSFPALKLLFGHVDRLRVRMGESRAAPVEVADALDRTRKIDKLDARIETMRVGALLVRDLRMRKRGPHVSGEALVTDADLAAALPVSLGLRPVQSGDGSLVMEATVPILGRVRARLSPREGALVIAPEGVAGGLAALTVFSDPRVRVDSVGAQQRPGGFVVSGAATLV